MAIPLNPVAGFQARIMSLPHCLFKFLEQVTLPHWN